MRNKKYLEAFSGISLGSLIGIIIGLSVSQIVGVVLAALTSLLAAFFGLKPETEKTEEGSKKLFVIGCFSLAALIGIFLGIYLRNYNLLSVSKKEYVSSWKDAGFHEKEAKAFLIYNELGLVPEGYKGENHPNGLSPRQATFSTVLFSGFDSLNVEELRIKNYNNDVNEQLNGFILRGGKLKAFGEVVKSQIGDPEEKKIILNAALDLISNK